MTHAFFQKPIHVAIPFYAPRPPLGREAVMVAETDNGQWTALDTKEVTFSCYKVKLSRKTKFTHIKCVNISLFTINCFFLFSYVYFGTRECRLVDRSQVTANIALFMFSIGYLKDIIIHYPQPKYTAIARVLLFVNRPIQGRICTHNRLFSVGDF